MFGPCKVCAEKDLRIADLKTYIATLEALVSPKYTKDNSFVSEVHLEADRVLSSSDQISDEHRRQLLELEDEANALLTGTY